MADIQLQIQNLVKLANIAKNQLADIKTTLLQIGETHKTQIGEDIYSISEELKGIIYGDMEYQTHHIQVLLADELDYCRDKRDEQVKEHIKMIQEVYQESYYNTSQSMIINKKKQKEGVVQDKLYVILPKSSRPKTSEPIFIQEEVYNLEKMLKILQSPVKTIPFLSLSYYKAI